MLIIDYTKPGTWPIFIDTGSRELHI